MRNHLLTITDCDNRAADIIFVLDGSSSIYPPDFVKVVGFINETVRHFRISATETRVGLITYSNYVQVRFTPSTYLDRNRLLTVGLSTVAQPYGETRTDLALERARELFGSYSREGIPKIAVVVTDGGSDHPSETVRQATLAHQAGIIVFAIGVGNAVVQTELQAMATNNTYVHNVENFDGLSALQCLFQIPDFR